MHENWAEELLWSKHDFEDFTAWISSISELIIMFTAWRIFKNPAHTSNKQKTYHSAQSVPVGTIVQWARTLLLHAISKCLDIIIEYFWPFAIWYMVLFHNSSNQVPTWKLSDFGSLTYVLHKQPQDGDHLYQSAMLITLLCHLYQVDQVIYPKLPLYQGLD